MKYLYYSLYLFYVKVIHVQNDWAPIISITGVMSFLFIALFFSVYNAYIYAQGYSYPFLLSIFIWIGLSFSLYKIMYDYYKSREVKLLKEMNCKPLWQKFIIVFISIIFIVLVVRLWMYDGMFELYQYIKKI